MNQRDTIALGLGINSAYTSPKSKPEMKAEVSTGRVNVDKLKELAASASKQFGINQRAKQQQQQQQQQQQREQKIVDNFGRSRIELLSQDLFKRNELAQLEPIGPYIPYSEESASVRFTSQAQLYENQIAQLQRQVEILQAAKQEPIPIVEQEPTIQERSKRKFRGVE